MDKRNNMKQAMYEMFGVGAAPAAKSAPPSQKEHAPKEESSDSAKATAKTPAPASNKEPDPAPAVHTAQPPAVASYLAPGTVMEGTLRSVGDVEIAGDFKGDITTGGTVILHSNIQGNLSVSSLNLSGCSLVGDVVASGMVAVSGDSRICGNVTAKDLQCAGQIAGDLTVSGNTALDGTAQINGNIRTGSMSVVRGAVIRGSIEMSSFSDKGSKPGSK